MSTKTLIHMLLPRLQPTAMAAWTAFPYPGEYRFDAERVRQHWARLHAGDVEPLPADPHPVARLPMPPSMACGSAILPAGAMTR